MTKKLCAAALLALSPVVSADTFWGVYLGGGIWQSQYDGNLGESTLNVDVRELGHDKSRNNFFNLAIEHPVPLLPNLRLARINLDSSETAVISHSFSLNGVVFEVDAEVASTLDLSHTDVTLYYELLDNQVSFDLGLTLRGFNGEASARSEETEESVKLDDWLPLVYARLEFELPLTGFSLGAIGQGISYKDSRLTDYEVYLRYTFDSALDVAVNLGYRSLAVELDESDIQADVELTGPYVGLLLHF